MNFIDAFICLCNIEGKAPTALCKELNIPNSSYSFWTKNNSFPRPETLMKIKNYFDLPTGFFRDDYICESELERRYSETIEQVNTDLDILMRQNEEATHKKLFAKSNEDASARYDEMKRLEKEITKVARERDRLNRISLYKPLTEEIKKELARQAAEETDGKTVITPKEILKAGSSLPLTQQEQELIESYRKLPLMKQMKLLQTLSQLLEE